MLSYIYIVPSTVYVINSLVFWKSHKRLVGGGFNPFEKYARDIGSFPQGSGRKQKYLEIHHLVYFGFKIQTKPLQ